MNNHFKSDLGNESDVEFGMKRQRHIVFCVALAAFTFQFEAFLVNVSLPTIAIDLGCTTTMISFVVIGYLFAATISFLPAGWLGDRFGLKKVFLIGCALAVMGTVGSGLAINLEMLWASRFVQGVGTGAMVALGYAIIPAWIDGKKVGWAYGLVSTGAGLGMVLGLPVGGLLNFAPWHWIFLATVPILLSLLLISWLVLPWDNHAKPKSKPFDAIGAVLFSLFLTSTVLGLSLGDELGWGSPAIVLSLITAGILTALMVARSLSVEDSYFSGSLFHVPGFALSLANLFVFAAMLGGILFLMPFYFEFSCGQSTFFSSMFLMAYPMSFAPIGRWAGRLADRFDSPRLMIAAMLMCALACAFFALIEQRSSPWIGAVFLILMGVASGMFMAPNNRFAMARTSPDRRAESGALLPIALNMGTLFGIALFDTIFSQYLSSGSETLQVFLADQSASMATQLNLGFVRSAQLATAVFFTIAACSFFVLRSIARRSKPV